MLSGLQLILTSTGPLTVDLVLRDADGRQLAYRQVDFGCFPPAGLLGLFELPDYLEQYAGPEPNAQAAALGEVGVVVAQQVLGVDLFAQLVSSAPGTLTIQLPAGRPDDRLAAWLARLPWELACPAPAELTLAGHNLRVRVTDGQPASPARPVRLAEREALRILFVFAEARDSRPLDVRQERRALLELFEQRVYPTRRVVAHFLSHGVTRERLETQVRQNGGYHLVHWSGHGGHNLLELARADGTPDQLSGAQLLEVFRRAGGFLPQLVFLSACQSGDSLAVTDWPAFEALAQGQRTAPPLPALPREPAATQPGYTSTAHALLRAGVPSVVAMRYAVGDDYARELALDFYEALLSYATPQSVAAALATARRLRQDAPPAAYAASDHATPVLYGDEQPDLPLEPGTSPALSARSPRLHPDLAELPADGQPHFVGRTWELAGLGANFIGTPRLARPVAAITGLGGMGKTALAAEALALWEQQFDYVLVYQAKPPATLLFEDTLRDIHERLLAQEGRYYHHLREWPADAIYRPEAEHFRGEARRQKLTDNLLRALRHEAILLVFDNFETNLRPNTGANLARSLWTCQDPAWEKCLTQLASGVPAMRSRVLITCRRPLAALAGTAAYTLSLGPLTADEAALYVRGHQGLRQLFLAGSPAEQSLGQRLLRASRFHPLLLDRLTQLATGGPARRPQLLAALTALESRADYDQLPRLFDSRRGNPAELAYLEDALTTSLDLLIGEAGPDARRLLWLLALPNEPLTWALLNKLWHGETPTQSSSSLAASPPMPLGYLRAVGLVTARPDGPADADTLLTCHELVRERIQAWVQQHPQELPPATAAAYRQAYDAWLSPEPTAAGLQEQAAREREQLAQAEPTRPKLVRLEQSLTFRAFSYAFFKRDRIQQMVSRDPARLKWQRPAARQQPKRPKALPWAFPSLASIIQASLVLVLLGALVGAIFGIAWVVWNLLHPGPRETTKAAAPVATGQVSVAGTVSPSPAAAPLIPLTLTSFSLKPNALNVARDANLLVTFSRMPVAAELARLRVFSSQYGGHTYQPASGNEEAGSFRLAGPKFRPGESVSVSLPTGATTGKVYQFTTVASPTSSGRFEKGLAAPLDDASATALGDVDGDGDLDVVSTHSRLLPNARSVGIIRISLNDGQGSFHPGFSLSTDQYLSELQLGDVDGDNDLDLLVAYSQYNTGRSTVSFHMNDGHGNFQPGQSLTVAQEAASLILGDTDGDGDLDLLTAGRTRQQGNTTQRDDTNVLLHLNDSQGRFGDGQAIVSGSAFRPMALGDVDNDGDLDLLVGNTYSDALLVWANDGQNHFKKHWTVKREMEAIAVGDLNGDGYLDLLLASKIYGTVNVQFNDGHGRFRPGETIAIGDGYLDKGVSNIALGDVDGDGDLDVLPFYDGYRLIQGSHLLDDISKLRVLLNNGRGTLRRGPAQYVCEYHLGPTTALGDLDNNGSLDVLAVSAGKINVQFNKPRTP